MKKPLLLLTVLAIGFSQLFSAATDPTALYVTVMDHGAIGDGVADDTAALNAAIAWAKSNGYKTVFIPVGTYRITSTLTKLNDSFNMVSLVGESSSGSVLRWEGGGPAVETAGGSGGITHAQIKDLTLVGNDSNTAVRIRGTGGVKISHCRFLNLGLGIEFSNDVGSGTFTEFSFAENCSFMTTCQVAVKFTRGAGNASFHGSGLRNSTISRDAANMLPAIQVGNAGEIVYLYNAPLDFTVWTRNGAEVIRVESASSVVSVHGTIRIENMADPTWPVLAGGEGQVHFAGEVLSWGGFNFGKLKQVDSFKRNLDGSINAAERLVRIKKVLTEAATTFDDVKAGEMGAFVSVTLVASNYDYRYLLFISHNGFGSNGHVSILATQRSLNQAGLGAPTFTVDSSGRLVVTNSNYAGNSVEVYIGLSSMGGRRQFFADTIAPAPSLLSAVSRKTHGMLGDFDIPLAVSVGDEDEPAPSTIPVECRRGDALSIVLLFDRPVYSLVSSIAGGMATLTRNDYNIGNATTTLHLSGVENEQRLTLALQNIAAIDGGVLDSATLRLRVLEGDATGDGNVNAADVNITKSRVSTLVSATNFRSDFTQDGNINAADVNFAKSRASTFIH